MKILLYSDNHFCSYSSIIRERGKTFSLRLENQIQSLNWVERLSEENGCDMEICLGDFFDKETLNSEEISALRSVNWNKKEKHFIVGNHEMGSSDLTYNSTNVLSSIGTVHSKPYVLRFDSWVVDFIIIPYVLESNRMSLQEHISMAYANSSYSEQTNNYKVILTHNDISGVRYGGFESRVGFPISEIDQCCNLFIDGHIHNQSGFGNRCLILGNLTGLNFSEDATKYKHSAYILDTVGLKIEEFENPYAFNFYKLETYNVEILNSFKKNSIVSIKVPQSDVENVRDSLRNNPNVVKFRVNIIPEREQTTHSITGLVAKDHIVQFKEYIMQTLGDSKILCEELSLL